MAMGQSIQDNDYFSLENLNELSRIEEHLDFAEELVEKYLKFAEGNVLEKKEDIDWQQIKKQLQLIKKKKDDKKLNISVIGEFSTGKSTFINALLRKELLASSAMQGTTVASTIIDYDSEYKVLLEYLDGTREDRKYSDFEQLKQGLEKVTTTPSIARLLKTVNVSLPAEILKNNFRIIDTPGTNVTEAWHEDVTIRTLKEVSDISIILISAEKPASETMLRFVRTNIESILPQCVFVVTKLDMIRSRERKKLLAYIKMKLESELDIQDAVVLPYVSPFVLHSESMNQTKKNSCIFEEADHREEEIAEHLVQSNNSEMVELLKNSLETEQMLIEHTAKQKTLAITKKLTMLLEEMYESISIKMGNISGDYEKKLALLNRSKTTDLRLFVQKEKEQRLMNFNNSMKIYLDTVIEMIEEESKKSTTIVVEKIDTPEYTSNLRDYITKDLGTDCSKQAMAMISEMDVYYNLIQEEFKKEMAIFCASFLKLYDTLRIVPIDMSQSKYNFPTKIEIETANISAVANYIAEQIAKDNSSMFGGAAAGAAAGTLLLPGIGTVLGAIGGFFVGAIKTPTMSEIKKQCKDKLRPQLVNYYSGVSNQMISGIEKYIEQMRVCLSKEMDGYLERYHSEIEQRIMMENKKRSMIQRRIDDLNQDRYQMQTHKKLLESVMVQLNQLGRKEVE